jgi:protein-L-isoaspartate O-methyltransferase
LKAQLAIGGRLVVPVGPEVRHQDLLKITRKSDMEYEEENLGGVVFVPLVGEGGWAERGSRDTRARQQRWEETRSLRLLWQE